MLRHTGWGRTQKSSLEVLDYISVPSWARTKFLWGLGRWQRPEKAEVGWCHLRPNEKLAPNSLVTPGQVGHCLSSSSNWAVTSPCVGHTLENSVALWPPPLNTAIALIKRHAGHQSLSVLQLKINPPPRCPIYNQFHKDSLSGWMPVTPQGPLSLHRLFRLTKMAKPSPFVSHKFPLV